MNTNEIKKNKFCSDEKAKLARQQEATSKQGRSAPLQEASAPLNQNVVNRQHLGHSELFALARWNQWAQKRPRSSRNQPHRQTQNPKQQQRPKTKSPGSPKRSQWLKDAKARSIKPSCSCEFDRKSKTATLQQTKENKQVKEPRKLLYSSSSDNKGFPTVNKSKLKFSPTVKVLNIEWDSPGTPGTPFEILTSSNTDDFMNDKTKEPH